AALWTLPQATAWDQSGLSLVMLAVLHEEVVTVAKRGGTARSAVFAEMRQIEDRHGLSPKALAGLRWRIGEPDEEGEPETAPSPSAAARRRRALKVMLSPTPGGPT